MTKKIEAIVQEDKLHDVKEALAAIGIVGLNVTECRGRGRQGGITLTGRTGTYKVDLLPRVQFNIVLSDRNVNKTIDAICKAAYTGSEGDGMIFILPVEDVVRIRTRERGHDALMYPGDIDEQRAAAGGVLPGNGVTHAAPAPATQGAAKAGEKAA